MIKKKKIIKDPQRLKHKVRFDIELFQDPKNNEIKLLIVFIQKGGIADGKLLLGDKIKSIKNEILKNFGKLKRYWKLRQNGTNNIDIVQKLQIEV